MTLNLESTILKHFDELEDPTIERSSWAPTDRHCCNSDLGST